MSTTSSHQDTSSVAFDTCIGVVVLIKFGRRCSCLPS